jgi:hypothetical protein
MVFLTHIAGLNLSTRRCALEHGTGRLKTFGFGAHLRLYAESLVGTSEPCSPVHGIAKKRMKRIVQAGVSRMYPAFCTVTASGSNRRPAAGSFFCFGLRRLRLRFPSATDPP